MAKLAVDIANYAGELSQSTIDAWREAGVTRVVVRASTEDAEKERIARQQMQAVIDGGFEPHLYEWLYFDDLFPPELQTQAVLDIYGKYPFKRIWVDCEERTLWSQQKNREWIWWAMSVQTQYTSYGIYTGPRWWREKTGNTEIFDAHPFWLAGYAQDTNRIWLPEMVQYQGSVQLGSVSVDLSLY